MSNSGTHSVGNHVDINMFDMYVCLGRQILKARLSIPHDITIGYEVRDSDRTIEL